MDATKLLAGCVALCPLHYLPPCKYKAFATWTAMFGLEALPVPTLQAKTLLQKCHFPEGPSKVCTQGVRRWSPEAVGRGEASWDPRAWREDLQSRQKATAFSQEA